MFFFKGFASSSAGEESVCNAGDPSSIPRSGRSSGEGIGYPFHYFGASLVAQMIKNPPAMQETWVQSLGWEDPLEKGMAYPLSILASCLENSLDRGAWQTVRHKCASFTFKVKKKVHNKQGTKKSPILKVRYKFRAEPRKKNFWCWYGWASCLSYWTERAIYKTELLAVRFAVLSCESLLIFFQRALYFTESESCHLNITQIFHLLLFFYP